MISNDRLEKALTFISSTDERSAAMKAEVERKHFRAKQCKAAIIEYADGAMELRRAVAENSQAYKEAIMDYLNAFNESMALENKRKTENLIIEVWRSLNANRRQGNI